MYSFVRRGVARLRRTCDGFAMLKAKILRVEPGSVRWYLAGDWPNHVPGADAPKTPTTIKGWLKLPFLSERKRVTDKRAGRAQKQKQLGHLNRINDIE